MSRSAIPYDTHDEAHVLMMAISSSPHFPQIRAPRSLRPGSREEAVATGEDGEERDALNGAGGAREDGGGGELRQQPKTLLRLESVD